MTMCDVTQESTPSPMSPLSDLLPGSEMGGAGTGRNSVSPKPSISPLPPSDPAPPASELPSYSEATAAVDQTALTCVNEVRGHTLSTTATKGGGGLVNCSQNK